MSEHPDNVSKFPSPKGLEEKREAREDLVRLVQIIEKLERDPQSGTAPLTQETLLEFSNLKRSVESFLSGLMKRPYDERFQVDLGELYLRMITSDLPDYLTDEEVAYLGLLKPDGGPYSG